MTLEERVAHLEALLARYALCFDSPDGTMAAQYQGRLGIQTRYWADQPRGQGAAFAIGSSADRFALYAEVDNVECHDKASAAIYAS